jgi:hypothetical protein
MSKRRHNPQVVPMCLTIPKDIRVWLEAEAAKNLAPMNTVVVLALREKMRADQRERIIQQENS